MTTEIYGASDDLIEFRGDVFGEVGHYGNTDDPKGKLIACSDGTLLDVRYGKDGKAIWGVTVIEKGSLFDRIDPCTDPEAERYSDTAHFRDGLKWAYAADEYERVK